MLLIILSHLDLAKRGPYTALLVLDIASHWAHLSHTDRLMGHHKAASTLQKKNFLLQEYYSCYPLFGYCCVGNESYLLLEYAKQFVTAKGPWKTAIGVSR